MSHSDELLAVFLALPDTNGWSDFGCISFAVGFDVDLFLRTFDRCAEDFNSWPVIFRLTPVLSKLVFIWPECVSLDFARFGESPCHSSCSGAKSCSLFRFDSFGVPVLCLVVRDLGIFWTDLFFTYQWSAWRPFTRSIHLTNSRKMSPKILSLERLGDIFEDIRINFTKGMNLSTRRSLSLISFL